MKPRLTLAFSLLCACAAAPVKRTPSARAIILLSIDDFRVDRIGAYGSAAGLTPVLDRFAAQACVFEDATAQATWTLPSHSSMLSSLLPSSHHAGGTPPDHMRALSPDARLLPQWLKPAGYKSVAFVSGPPLDPRYGLSTAFDEYHAHAWSSDHQEMTLDDAAAWAERHAGEKYFLFVHTFLVHRYQNFVDDKSEDIGRCPPPLNFSRDFAAEEAALTDPFGPACRSLRRRYDWAARCLDRKLEDFLGRVTRAAGPDTLIAITADHGEMLCSARDGQVVEGHAKWPFEELIHIPLIVKFPGGLCAGGRVAGPVMSVDIAPTLAAAAGVAPPPGLAGADLAFFVTSPPPPARPRYCEGQNWSSVSAGRYKLIETEGAPARLYDLRDDPGEQVDIARRSAKEVAAMRELLDRRPRIFLRASAAPTADEQIESALKAAGYLP